MSSPSMAHANKEKPKYTDDRRRSFLDALDKSVTDWEGRFLSDLMNAQVFTPKEQRVIDRMIENYGHRIGAW